MRSALSGFAGTVLLALVTACGGGGDTSDTTVGQVGLPACAKPRAADSPPPDLPVSFPLPAGTVISSVDSPHPSQLVVAGVIPAELQDAASFFNRTLPEHGYQVGIGDAEGTESEAPFTGNGYRGKWRVNQIPDCSALTLTLVLIEQP